MNASFPPSKAAWTQLRQHAGGAVAVAALLLAATIAFGVLTSAAPAHKQARGHDRDHMHGDHHPQPKTPPKPPKSFYGVVSQAPIDDEDLAKMQSTGITVLRSGFYWQAVQPNDADSFDFSRYDNLVRESAKYGITVLPYVYGSPDWVAKGLDGNTTCDTDCDRYAPQSGAARAALTNFTSALAARYGPGGNFWSDPSLNQGVPYTPIHSWQIWNEENSKGYYLPQPDPAKFAKVLSAADRGIRSQDPGATIILGGVFGIPRRDKTSSSSGYAIPASTFVRALLEVKGAKRNFDGVGLHPYSRGLNFIKKQVTVLRAALDKSGDPGASMWITETGIESGGSDNPLNLGSKKAQAKRLANTYRLFAEHRKDWNVKLVAWFAWQDVPGYQGSCFFCERMGLVDGHGIAKPSLRAYRRARNDAGTPPWPDPRDRDLVGQREQQVDDPKPDQHRDEDADEKWQRG